MPNYRIPEDIRQHIISRASNLALQPEFYALDGFPLSMAQVQDHCAGLTPEQAADIQRLHQQGVRTIERYRDLRLAFLREQLPGLRRSVVCHLRVPSFIFVGRATHYSVSTTTYDPDASHYIVPRVAELTAETRAALVQYLNTAVRQHRLREIVDSIVPALLEKAPTTSHVHALWPLLTTLVADNHFSWRERFRNPTRSLKAYQPDPETRSLYGPYMEAAETVILAGLLLDLWEPKGNVIVTRIEHWERRPGDTVFPLES
jgi:hypothetical protein